MPKKYLVERHLPDITPEQLKLAASRAKEISEEMQTEGTPVRYLRSIFVPGEAKCYCLFEGTSPDQIRQVNETADIPFQRILEANQVTADEV